MRFLVPEPAVPCGKLEPAVLCGKLEPAVLCGKLEPAVLCGKHGVRRRLCAAGVGDSGRRTPDSASDAGTPGRRVTRMQIRDKWRGVYGRGLPAPG
jgi:hypothetical protein